MSDYSNMAREIVRLESQARELTDKARALRDAIADSMAAAQQKDVAAGGYRVRLIARKPKVIIADMDKVPAQFKRQVWEADSKAIQAAILADGEYVPGVELASQDGYVRIDALG
jgi:nitrogen fixation protein FixH